MKKGQNEVISKAIEALGGKVETFARKNTRLKKSRKKNLCHKLVSCCTAVYSTIKSTFSSPSL